MMPLADTSSPNSALSTIHVGSMMMSNWPSEGDRTIEPMKRKEGSAMKKQIQNKTKQETREHRKNL